jgi:hypothetical protein
LTNILRHLIAGFAYVLIVLVVAAKWGLAESVLTSVAAMLCLNYFFLLSDQADAIVETASTLVALDRRDLVAAWQRAHTVLEALPRPESSEREQVRIAPALRRPGDDSEVGKPLS